MQKLAIMISNFMSTPTVFCLWIFVWQFSRQDSWLSRRLKYFGNSTRWMEPLQLESFRHIFRRQFWRILYFSVQYAILCPYACEKEKANIDFYWYGLNTMVCVAILHLAFIRNLRRTPQIKFIIIREFKSIDSNGGTWITLCVYVGQFLVKYRL